LGLSGAYANAQPKIRVKNVRGTVTDVRLGTIIVKVDLSTIVELKPDKNGILTPPTIGITDIKLYVTSDTKLSRLDTSNKNPAKLEEVTTNRQIVFDGTMKPDEPLNFTATSLILQ